MTHKKEPKKEKGSLAKKVIIYALAGGGIGAAIGILGYFTGILVSSVEGIIALSILGISLGTVAGILIALSSEKNEGAQSQNDKKTLRNTLKNANNHSRLQLRQEQLEISKELTQLAEVTSHKEIITEEKKVTVPVTREELVIEKRNLANNCDNAECEVSEVMRIPLTEEQVNISKAKVKLEDVSIYTNRYEEIQHIEETLKKENAHIETSGDITVVDKDDK